LRDRPTAMPRGRFLTGMRAITCALAASITTTAPPVSSETDRRGPLDAGGVVGVAAEDDVPDAGDPQAAVSVRRMRTKAWRRMGAKHSADPSVTGSCLYRAVDSRPEIRRPETYRLKPSVDAARRVAMRPA
jgi:hypothetical protein